MKRTYKMINGHIEVKNPLVQELPALAIRLKSGRTTYRFCGSYDRHSQCHAVSHYHYYAVLWRRARAGALLVVV